MLVMGHFLFSSLFTLIIFHLGVFCGAKRNHRRIFNDDSDERDEQSLYRNFNDNLEGSNVKYIERFKRNHGSPTRFRVNTKARNSDENDRGDKTIDEKTFENVVKEVKRQLDKDSNRNSEQSDNDYSEYDTEGNKKWYKSKPVVGYLPELFFG